MCELRNALSLQLLAPKGYALTGVWVFRYRYRDQTKSPEFLQALSH